MNFETKYKLDLTRWVMNISGVIFALLIPTSTWVYVGWINVDSVSLTLTFLLSIMGVSACVLAYSIVSCIRIVNKELKASRE